MDKKACPFCGGTALDVIVIDDAIFIACADRDCRAYGPSANSEQEAIDAWNKRPGQWMPVEGADDLDVTIYDRELESMLQLPDDVRLCQKESSGGL